MSPQNHLSSFHGHAMAYLGKDFEIRQGDHYYYIFPPGNLDNIPTHKMFYFQLLSFSELKLIINY